MGEGLDWKERGSDRDGWRLGVFNGMVAVCSKEEEGEEEEKEILFVLFGSDTILSLSFWCS